MGTQSLLTLRSGYSFHPHTSPFPVCCWRINFRGWGMDIQKQLIAEYERELNATRKMLDAVPADADLSWKANPKCMTLGRLAAHVTEAAGSWGVDTLSKDGLVFDMAS